MTQLWKAVSKNISEANKKEVI